MPVRESGWQPEDGVAQLSDIEQLIDRAAQEHAEAIVEAAADYGYIRSIKREIRTTGVGMREIVDPGVAMTWLAGKTVPLRNLGIIRRATTAAIAAGGWRYPGREQPMQDAAQDPRVLAVVERWQKRLAGESD